MIKFKFQIISILLKSIHTNRTALIQPSFSGWLVTCAYFPQTTLPEGVVSPKSLVFTSIILPFVIIFKLVYKSPCGFFLTPMILRQNVVLSSGCVTCAFFILNPLGLIYLSYLGGLRVKSSPTYDILLMIRFHYFLLRLPLRMTWNISPSDNCLTDGSGTSHLPPFSLRFCFTEFDNTLDRLVSLRSIRYAGTEPSFI